MVERETHGRCIFIGLRVVASQKVDCALGGLVGYIDRISATVVTKIFRVGIISDKIASRTVCRQVDGLGFGGREFAASIGRGIKSIVLFHCFSGEHIYSDTVVRFPSGVVCTRCHAYITVHMQGCRAAIPCCIAERRFIVTTTGQSDDGEC